MNAEAGWYPDATRVGTERYWDGDAWTEESRWPGTHPFTTPVPNDPPAPDATGTLEPVVPTFRPIVTGMPHESTVGFWLPPTDSLVPPHKGGIAVASAIERRSRTMRTKCPPT